MGRLPRYQRLGVRPRQFQDIDYAGFRGQARAGQAMSEAFDQMSGFLYKKQRSKRYSLVSSAFVLRVRNHYWSNYKPRAAQEG